MNDETSTPATILVVDDEEPIRKMLVAALRSANEYRVFDARDGLEAQQILSAEPVDLVITDLVMPHIGGDALIRWGKEHHPDVAWIILTGQGTMASAVEAVRMGAFDFVLKGADAVTSLLPRARNAVQQRRHDLETRRLHEQIAHQNVRLGEQVAALRDACQLLTQQAETIEEDFVRAAGIQRALLPREAPSLDGVAIDALYRPCDRVGGDLYDVVRLDEHRLGICVADAAGHGVAAALLAVVFKSRLRLTDPLTGVPREPKDVFADLNDHLVEECRAPRMFVSAAYALFDAATREATIASAGHPPVLVHRSNGRVEWIARSGPALGLASGAAFSQERVVLEPGDQMLFYTDGVYQSVQDEPGLTTEYIGDLLAHERLAGIDLLRRLLDLTRQNTHGCQQDDITMLVLSLAPVSSQLDNGGAAEAPAHARAGSGRFDMAFGHAGAATVIRLQGHGDWTYAAAFHQASLSALDERRALAFDLARCRMLDSTFLGTIHEIVDRADAAGVPVGLYGVTPQIAGLFDELGMGRVLAHRVEDAPPVPQQWVSLQEASSSEASQRRILRAHETLAALNEQNREQFAKVIEYLSKAAAP